MDATSFLIASQVILLGVSAVLIALLVARIVRIPASRALLPQVAMIGILVTSVVVVVGGSAQFGRIIFILLSLLLATFPDGRFVPRWTFALVLAWIVLVIVEWLGAGLTDQLWWWMVPTASMLTLLGAQLYRYVRRSAAPEREAVRWAILGLALSAVFFLIIELTGDGLIAADGPASVAWAQLATIPFLVGPAIGLIRPRLWNVDAVFRWFLAGVAATLPLALVYWLTTVLAGSLGATVAGAGWLGAAVVAAAAYPVLHASWRLATILVYRGRGDADTAAARLAERLDDLPDPLAVSQTVAQAVADAVRADTVELHGDGLFSARVGPNHATGGAASVAEEFPISFHGDVLATLVVHPRPGERSLTPYDRALVERLALHSAPALHGARALADLSVTHARLLLAREEERRRLRRDLHDDLSPTLSGLALSAAALAKRADGVDRALAETARDLASDIQDAVEQTREIAYGLRPPILDDRGLVAAIRDRVHGAVADRLRVDVVAPEELLPLPAAVDLAALRIVQEAVANVRHHADASRCIVLIEREPGELRLRIEDDGRGIPPRVRSGIGLTSIRDRARELGGSTTIGSSPDGGASIAVRLPFVEPHPRTAEVPV